jgi:hypothetical protein
MAKAELKTKQTTASVDDFLNTVADKQKREDSFAILNMMKKATKMEPKMWGAGIIGFGNTSLKYASGRELDWFKMGFAPRKGNISLYLCGTVQTQAALLKKLGKHKTGVGCLYINKLEEVSIPVLEELIQASSRYKSPVEQ